jgi:hypothetical protein
MTKQQQFLKILEEVAFIDRELKLLKDYLPDEDIITNLMEIAQHGKGYYFFPDGSSFKLDKYDLMRILLAIEDLRKKLNKPKFIAYLQNIFSDGKNFKKFIKSLDTNNFMLEPSFA